MWSHVLGRTGLGEGVRGAAEHVDGPWTSSPVFGGTTCTSRPGRRGLVQRFSIGFDVLPAGFTGVLRYFSVANLLFVPNDRQRRGGIDPGYVPGMHEAAPDLLAIASALLPGVRLDDAFVAADGNVHHVLLIPGFAAVRVSKRPLAAASMPRRVEVLRQLASAGLPFRVPEPLTPVTMFGDRAAVAVSWIDGAALPEGVGDPALVAEVLAAVRSVPLDDSLLAAVDGRTQGPSWSTVVAEEVLPRLPARWQSEGQRRLDAVLAMEPVPDALVHGDLGGSNVHWSAEGKLVGILDWDLAMPADPAIDAALMAWHGWDNVRRAVSGDTYRRARTWDALFGVGHLVATMNGRPMTNPDGFVAAIVPWLEATTAARPA
ncbi:aminoglycoside phosphotransferase family protein [Amycolatopsis ultiminotia]